MQIRHVDAGSCNGCEVEIGSAFGLVHDGEWYGARLVASPRHADRLLVTGVVTRSLAEPWRRTFDAVPAPKLVVAVGDCASDCGVFAGAYGWCRAGDRDLRHVLCGRSGSAGTGRAGGVAGVRGGDGAGAGRGERGHVCWELMALASLVLVVAEHRRGPQVASAGRWYAVMTHLGFVSVLSGLLVFVAVLVGFGSKAGIVPLHAWLPRVDPSFFNWPALADAIVPDFPLTNKSFNLSCAGNDL